MARRTTSSAERACGRSSSIRSSPATDCRLFRIRWFTSVIIAVTNSERCCAARVKLLFSMAPTAATFATDIISRLSSSENRLGDLR